MTDRQFRELGLEQLAAIDSKNAEINQWKTWLNDYQCNDKYPDERYVWLTCVLALKAVHNGNFGVGSILIDGSGTVVAQGHNEVFSPYFRSDRHAEMVVMDRFEDNHPGITGMEGYVLYTSFECCPMCLTRLIISGIKKVLYAAPDKDGGMVCKMKDMPPVLVEFAKGRVFGQASCSKNLISAASRIFRLNLDELDEKLRNR